MRKKRKRTRNTKGRYASEGLVYEVRTCVCGCKNTFLCRTDLEQKFITHHNFHSNCSPLKGKKFPAAWRKALSKAHIGNKHTEEAKRKIGIASSLRKHSEESKRKISLGNKGKKKMWSRETRRKMRLRLEGKTYEELYGTKRAAEIKQKQSEQGRGRIRSPEAIRKTRKKCLGQKRSLEFCKRMRKSHLGKFRGKDSPNWKGGVTTLYKQIRSLDEYRQWRSNTFQHDNWTCKTCNIKGGCLQAHHIKPFALILQEHKIISAEQARKCKELWDINNGVTLCKDCHELTKSLSQLQMLGKDYAKK